MRFKPLLRERFGFHGIAGTPVLANFDFGFCKLLPSPFGRGAGGEGIVGRIARKSTAFSLPALTLTLSRRERGPGNLLFWDNFQVTQRQ